MDEVERSSPRNKSKVGAQIEHVFAVVKPLWGFANVRYPGLANIYLPQKQLSMGAYTPRSRCARKVHTGTRRLKTARFPCSAEISDSRLRNSSICSAFPLLRYLR